MNRPISISPIPFRDMRENDTNFADLVWKSVLTFDFGSIIMINKQYTTGKDGW